MGAIRLFLALVVASGHWQAMAPQPLQIDARVRLGFTGAQAVFFFYVISGFLISYTLSRNYTPDLQGAGRFWCNRAARIFSLYWPLAAFSLAVFPDARPQHWSDLFTGIFLLGTDWRLAFASYPSDHWEALLHGLHPAWTLGAELTFYLLAPLIIQSWRLATTLFVCSLGVRGYLVWQLGPAMHETWTYYFAPTTFCFFLLGHFGCRLGGVASWSMRPVFGFSLLAASALIMTFGFNYDDLDSPRLWLSILCFAVAVPAVFEATKNVRWLNILGDLSYPVYLVHVLTFILLSGVIFQATAGLTGKLVPYLSILVALAMTTAMAILLLPIEKAVLYLRRARPRRMNPAAGTG
jgi:peptidoglycan/LPS O-acetylase OafA/YrhL